MVFIVFISLCRCTQVRKVFLLIREKKGVSPSDRLEQLFKSKLFDTVKAVDNDVVKKVHALAGDIDQPLLGLNVEDQNKLFNEVLSI